MQDPRGMGRQPGLHGVVEMLPDAPMLTGEGRENPPFAPPDLTDNRGRRVTKVLPQDQRFALDRDQPLFRDMQISPKAFGDLRP